MRKMASGLRWYAAIMLISVQLFQIDGDVNKSTNTSNSIANLNRILQTYDKKSRPNFEGPAVDVIVQIAVVAFGPISEKTSTFDLDIFLRQTWIDERLCFDGNQSITVNEDPKDLFWVPDTSFPNAVDSKKHYVTTTNSRVKINPSGLVYTSQRVSLKCTCQLDLTNFPMDVQTCSLNIESYAFTSNEIIYRWTNETSPVSTAAYKLQIEGYIIDNITTARQEIQYQTGATTEGFTWLILTFKVSRNFNYYLFHYYCPSCLLVSMTWATFWFPSHAFPARVTLIVTTLLSCIFIVQNSIAQLVRTSYRTSLEVFLSFNVFYIVMCIVEYLLVINMVPRSRQTNEKVVHLLHHTDKSEACRLKNDSLGSTNGTTTRRPHVDHSKAAQAKEIEATSHYDTEVVDVRKSLNSDCHFIDYWARILFPLTYTLFVIAYFAYYLSQGEA